MYQVFNNGRKKWALLFERYQDKNTKSIITIIIRHVAIRAALGTENKSSQRSRQRKTRVVSMLIACRDTRHPILEISVWPMKSSTSGHLFTM